LLRFARNDNSDWLIAKGKWVFITQYERRAVGGAYMPQPAFSLPKQWEDWTSWALGIWLLLSPWTLWFEKDATATRNALVVGLLIILAELFELSIFRGWEEWINVALGAWLVISPWALGVSNTAAQINFVVVGALVLALALHELWDMRSRASDAEPDAGS
jgi:hypothetical protein